MEDREVKREMAQMMFGGFVRCPTTGRIMEVLKGDDKVMCGCGKSNPSFPAEQTERTGTHFVARLIPATVDEFLDQEDK